MPMVGEEDNLSDNSGPYKDEKHALEEPDIEKDDKDLANDSLDTRNHARNMLSGYTTQDELLRSVSSWSLRAFRSSDQEFAAGISISKIKYNHCGF